MSWTITVRASAGSRTTPSSPWWATRSNRRGARRATPSTTTSTPKCRPSGRRRTYPGPCISRSSTGFRGSSAAGPVASTTRRRRRPRQSCRPKPRLTSKVTLRRSRPTAAPAGEHEGPVHRRLIRATLPRLPAPSRPCGASPNSPCARRLMAARESRRTAFGAAACSVPAGADRDKGRGRATATGRQAARPPGGGEGAWNRSGQPGSGGRGPGGQRQGRGDKKRSR